MEHPPNKHQTRYQYLESPQSIQTHKNVSINIWDNMLPPEHHTPTTLVPEKCNIAKAWNKNFKIAVMNMFKDPKENMKKIP